MSSARDSRVQEIMSVEFIRSFCLSFPHATEKLQWGDVLCFKVGGKIFALLSLSSVPPRLMFKCEPEIFAELVEQEDIIPAPYLGRYKWVSLERLDVLPRTDTKDLIAQSYGMVAAKARVGRTKTGRGNTDEIKPTRQKSKSRRACKLKTALLAGAILLNQNQPDVAVLASAPLYFRQLTLMLGCRNNFDNKPRFGRRGSGPNSGRPI